MNINLLACHFPTDPEILPERSGLVGPSTEYPIGFNIEEITKLYWNFKSFQFVGGAVNFSDIFSTFILGGGATGTVVGSMVGLTAVLLYFSVNVYHAGRSKISVNYKVKLRRTISSIENGITQFQIKPADFFGDQELFNNDKDPLNPLALDKTLKNVELGGFNKEVNEGSILAGARHTIFQNGLFIIIDFSDIVPAKRQYWPKIIIMMGPIAGFGPLFSSATSFEDRKLKSLNTWGLWNLPTLGGVIFRGNVIQMFGSSLIPLIWAPAAFEGYLGPGTRDCDRFYWDEFPDKDRPGYDAKIWSEVYDIKRSDPQLIASSTSA
jgi:hypothetical protein